MPSHAGEWSHRWSRICYVAAAVVAVLSITFGSLWLKLALSSGAEDYRGRAWATASHVAVRAAPSVGSEIRLRLTRNQVVDVLRGRGDWWEIRASSTHGYVCRSYLTVIGPSPAGPVLLHNGSVFPNSWAGEVTNGPRIALELRLDTASLTGLLIVCDNLGEGENDTMSVVGELRTEDRHWSVVTMNPDAAQQVLVGNYSETPLELRGEYWNERDRTRRAYRMVPR